MRHKCWKQNGFRLITSAVLFAVLDQLGIPTFPVVKYFCQVPSSLSHATFSVLFNTDKETPPFEGQTDIRHMYTHAYNRQTSNHKLQTDGRFRERSEKFKFGLSLDQIIPRGKYFVFIS